MKTLEIFNGKRGRYLALIPFLFVVVCCLYFGNLTGEINRTLLEEKILEKTLDIDLIADLTEAQGGQEALANSIAYLDAQPYTFAALYDEELNNISNRTASYTDLFNPFQSEEVLAAVRSNERGKAQMQYTPVDAEERTMYLYYRWVDAEQRVLAVVAISHYSVTNHAAAWVLWGAVAQTIITMILNVLMVLIIVRAGTFNDMRQGEKWRGE